MGGMRLSRSWLLTVDIVSVFLAASVKICCACVDDKLGIDIPARREQGRYNFLEKGTL